MRVRKLSNTNKDLNYGRWHCGENAPAHATQAEPLEEGEGVVLNQGKCDVFEHVFAMASFEILCVILALLWAWSTWDFSL